MNLKNYLKVEVILIFLLFLISSWDIFANFRLFGYSFRLFYVVELILIVLILFKRKRLLVFSGHTIFMFWVFFLVISIPNTSVPTRNIGYFIWLVFSYLLLILAVNYFRNYKKFVMGLKLYILSFLGMAFLGLIQFLVGLKGFSFMTTQWWIKGAIPRINGLSYEPSYYGTYLSGGSALLYWLTFVEKRKVLPYQSTITFFIMLVVVLSSSRIGILSLCFTVFLHILYRFFFPLLRGKLNKDGFKVTMASLVIVLSVMFLVLTHLGNFRLFLSGVGIFGTSSHSVSQRLQAMMDTFKVFLNNPIIGVSLGGIPSHRARLYGITIVTQLEAKHFEGVNVLLEVLAASGIFGFLFFLIFWANIFKVHFSLKKKIEKFSKKMYNLNYLMSISNSLLIMLIVEIFALTMNQNILRPYFWLSLAFYLSGLRLFKNEFNYAYSNRLSNA